MQQKTEILPWRWW